MKKLLAVLTLLLSLGVASCDLFPPPLAITVSYASEQYEEIVGNEFPVFFPGATDIADLKVLVPEAEIASHGPTLGGTIAVVTISSNQTFYVTGVRLENIRYRLTPADGNPIGSTSSIAYLHPVFGPVSPITPNLGLAPEAESAVVEILEGAVVNFDVGFSSALSMWDHIDADRDDTPFPEDDDEVVDISCSLFFEGYLENGAEFTGAFPPPLLVNITVEHDVP